MKKALYFNAALKTWKPVAGFQTILQAENALAAICKALGWQAEHVTKIELV